ncbi:MAG TPA: DUF6675 family protein, partial [Bryobacteraceae bacterium]
QPPVTRVWQRDELGAGWQPPACIGWTQPGFTSLVVTTARFRWDRGVDGLREVIGAISSLKGMPYWSTTHKAWHPLILDAYAVTAAKDGRRRGDFSANEIDPGARLYFEQEDSLSGKGTYELHILSVSPDRLVFDTHNLTTLRYLLVPVFHPGDVESVYFLEREATHVWRYYNMARLGENANGLVGGHAASSINRAIAYFRHLVGIPGDQEPPAAR